MLLQRRYIADLHPSRGSRRSATTIINPSSDMSFITTFKLIKIWSGLSAFPSYTSPSNVTYRNHINIIYSYIVVTSKRFWSSSSLSENAAKKKSQSSLSIVTKSKCWNQMIGDTLALVLSQRWSWSLYVETCSVHRPCCSVKGSCEEAHIDSSNDGVFEFLKLNGWLSLDL